MSSQRKRTNVALWVYNIRMYIQKAYSHIDEQTIIEDAKREGFEPTKFTNSPGDTYPPHKHTETKLLIFLRGSMNVKVGKDSFECKPGDKLVIEGDVLHEAKVGEKGCEFLWSEKIL